MKKKKLKNYYIITTCLPYLNQLIYDFLIDILETGVEPKAPNSPVVIRNTLETGK